MQGCCAVAQELSLQHISNILWAYVSFLEMRDPMAAAFLAELRERLRRATFNAQQLSNLLWSLCIAEVPVLERALIQVEYLDSSICLVARPMPGRSQGPAVHQEGKGGAVRFEAEGVRS